MNKFQKGEGQQIKITADSIKDDKERSTTFLVREWAGILTLSLQQQPQNFKVSPDNDIPFDHVLKQVMEDPFIPIRFRMICKGTQGREFFPFADHADDRLCHDDCVKLWLSSKYEAVAKAKQLVSKGIDKQLIIKTLDPWMYTCCVCTSTKWDEFFIRCHPWHKISGSKTVRGCEEILWENKINPNFPAEIHIQDLAIKMKLAMGANTPK